MSAIKLVFTLTLLSFASQVTAQQLESKRLQSCINKRMDKWERVTEKKFDDSCKKPAQESEECRISVVQIDTLREDALKKTTKQCSSKVKK
jgi:hypothetical protein